MPELRNRGRCLVTRYSQSSIRVTHRNPFWTEDVRLVLHCQQDGLDVSLSLPRK